MRPLTATCALALAACASGGPRSTDSPSWVALYGTYEFTGRIEGQATTTVFGTVRLEGGRYYVETSHGSCDGRLPQAPSLRLWVGCPGISVVLRRRGDAFEGEGEARVTVQEHVQRLVCRTDASGRRTCVTELSTVDVPRTGRITVRPGDTAG